MISTDDFIESIAKINSKDNTTGNRTAIIDSVNGNTATVTFEGEDKPRQKGYHYLTHYKPAVGDRVYLQKHGDSYLIMGEIS